MSLICLSGDRTLSKLWNTRATFATVASVDAGSDSRIIKGELRRTLIAGHRVLELWRDGTLIFAQIGDEDGISCGSKLPDAYKINQLALIETTMQFVALTNHIFSYARPAPTQIKVWIQLCPNGEGKEERRAIIWLHQ